MGRSGGANRGNRVEIARATETVGVAELEKALKRLGSKINVHFAGDYYVSLTLDTPDGLVFFQDPFPCMFAITSVARLPIGTPDEVIMDLLGAWQQGYRSGYQDGARDAELGHAAAARRESDYIIGGGDARVFPYDKGAAEARADEGLTRLGPPSPYSDR